MTAAVPRHRHSFLDEHYQQIASLDAYVVIAQARRHIELWTRRLDRSWSHRVLVAGDTLDLEAIQCRVTVDELYDEAGLT